MRYKDIECSVCGKKFDENSDVVVCPVCGAPYHRECWLAEGKCIHESEHAAGYRWEFPEKAEPEEQEKAPDAEKLADGVFKNGEGVVVCPYCKTPNYENDMYCRNCHAPLKNGAEQSTRGVGGVPPVNDGEYFGSNKNTDPEREEYVRNTEAMYNSYNIYGGLDPDSLIDGIPVREYAVFVGGKAPGKIIRKISTLERYGRAIAPAFAGLLGPIWFFRRKMVKIGAIMSAVLIVLFTASGILRLTAPYKTMVAQTNALMNEVRTSIMTVDEMREKMNAIQEEYLNAERTESESRRETAASFLNGVATYCIPACGFIGAISAYRKKVRDSILKTRAECSDMNTYMNELHIRGGTSAGLTFVGIAVCAFAWFMEVYFPMIIAGM